MSDPLVNLLINFGTALYYESRYFSTPAPELSKALGACGTKLLSKLAPERRYFRARIHHPRMEPPGAPYSPEEMGNPPPRLAKAGRLNSSGISRLYLASTKDVAAAEVRATTGDFVTLLEFSPKQEITVFDFRLAQERAEAQYRPLMNYLNRLISRPVDGYDGYEIVLSQWAVEFLKSTGVDAVIYGSTIRGRSRELKTWVSDIPELAPRDFYNVAGFYPYQWESNKESLRIEQVRELEVVVADDNTWAQMRALESIQENQAKFSAGWNLTRRSEFVIVCPELSAGPAPDNQLLS